jgi:osmotically inducible lipoprotein OsmB
MNGDDETEKPRDLQLQRLPFTVPAGRPITSINVNNMRGGDPMKRILSVAVVALTAGSLAACYSPEERALGGAAVGATAGAVIGGLATGRVGGAVAGGIIGAAGGAIVGAATAPRAYCPPRAPYLRYDAYGRAFCSWR